MDYPVTAPATYHRSFVNKFHPTALWAHSKTEAGQRAIRYSATSLICVGITQVLIIVFYNGVKLTPVQSNLSATMLTSIPAFALNKYWVWGKRGRAHMRREVLPFWAFTVAGWILSTGMVALVTRVAGGNDHLPRAWQAGRERKEIGHEPVEQHRWQRGIAGSGKRNEDLAARAVCREAA